MALCCKTHSMRVEAYLYAEAQRSRAVQPYASYVIRQLFILHPTSIKDPQACCPGTAISHLHAGTSMASTSGGWS